MRDCPRPYHPYDYLRGELAPAEADAARAHLMECESCAREAVAVEELRTELSRAPSIEPAPGFASRVAAAAAGLPRPAPPRKEGVLERFLPTWALSLAAHAVLFAGLAAWFYHRELADTAETPMPVVIGPAAPAVLVHPETRHAWRQGRVWLEERQAEDGSFGDFRATALAAIALQDEAAKTWVRDHVTDPSDAVDLALATLACGPTEEWTARLQALRTERGDWVTAERDLDAAWAPFLVLALPGAEEAYRIDPGLAPRSRREVWNGAESGPMAIGYAATQSEPPAVEPPHGFDPFAVHHLALIGRRGGDGVAWQTMLQDAQNENGSWNDDVTATALALLAVDAPYHRR